MAIQDTSLEKRLNELEASAVDTEEAEVLSQVPVGQEVGQDIVAEPMVDPEVMGATDAQFDSESMFAEGEKTQVAGIGDFIPKILKANKRRDTEKTAAFAARSKDPITNDDYVIVPYGEQQNVSELLANAETKPITGTPSDVKFTKKGKRVEGPNYTRTNINQINGPDSLKQFIQVVGDANNVDKVVMPLEEIAASLSKRQFMVYNGDAAVKTFDNAEDAQAFMTKSVDMPDLYLKTSQPYTPEYLSRIMDPKNPTVADPKEIHKMLLAQLNVVQQTEEMAKKVVKAKADGTLTDEMTVQFDQLFALAGELSKAVEGRTADIGRSLRMFGVARKATGGGVEMEELIKLTGGTDETVDRATKFLALPTTEAKAHASRMRFGWKTLPGIARDMWLTTWINGLLSSPLTHMKNTVGNLAFGAIQSPERYAAALIGSVRKNVFRQKTEVISFNEAHDYATGYFTTWSDALDAGIKGFKGNAADGAGKLEYKQPRDAFDVDFGDSNGGKAMSKGLRYWGKFVQLPGNALMGEDEFFKALGFMGELKALTRRSGDDLYAKLVADGVDDVDAIKQAADHMAKLRAAPPEELVKASVESSKRLTFTNELEGFLKTTQDYINAIPSPINKMFFPFIRTPTNLVLEAGKRSPAMFMSLKFLKGFKAGGREADLAIARVGLSSGLIGSLTVIGGLNGKVTGSGPKNFAQLDTLKGTGWRPYSFVLNKSDVSPSALAKLQSMTPVSVGADKYYISYAGLQPVGQILAISATLGEYFQLQSKANSQNISTREQTQKIVSAAVMAGFEMVGEMPTLQGAGELHSMLSGAAALDGDGLVRFAEGLTKKVTEFAVKGSPLGAMSSLVSTAERVMSPEKSLTMVSEGGDYNNIFSGSAKGFWTAWNEYTAHIPFYSDNLPLRRDPITGKEITVGEGNWGEAFNPFTRSDGTFSPAYAALVSMRVPVYSPPKKIDEYDMSAEQYNKWIEIVTAGGELEEAVVDAVEDQEGTEDLKQAQRAIRSTMTSAYKKAIPELLEYYPKLERYLDESALDSEEVGVYGYYD
jgi:hypothetical protein